MCERIARLLHPFDRLNAAQACSAWEGIMSSQVLLDDIWVVIRRNEEKDAAATLVNSRRKFRNLRLNEGKRVPLCEPSSLIAQLAAELTLPQRFSCVV